MVEQPERELVEKITDAVVSALKRQGGARPQPAPGSSTAARDKARADVQPPAGICTGDYSKFTELASRPVGAAPPASPQREAGGAPDAAAPAPTIAPLTGIITASQLQAAMDASTGSAVTLASDARLTPLAADLARQHPERIARHAGGAAANPGKRQDANVWLWWIDGHCPAVQELMTQQRSQIRLSGAGSRASALTQVVRELAGAVKAQQVAGGVLFVPNAARAMCYANRCPSLRAVVGTCGEAVEQGIRELGANVLVIEYPHHGPRAIEAMTTRMMQQPPKAAPAVQRELADLQRCG